MNNTRAGIVCALGLLLVLCLTLPRIGTATGLSPVLSRNPTPAAPPIQLQPVVSGLSSPVFVTHAGDGSYRLFIVEQGGKIKVLQPGAAATTDFLDITTRVLSGGERGLLGLAFHPFYKTNGRFFVYYTRAGDGAIQIAEYHVSASNPNLADTTEQIILTIPHPTNANHNGGTVVFGPDGMLYAGPGDGGGANDVPNNAQNINQLLGKILRIDIDHPEGATPYSSPSGNPFSGPATGRDEIYAWGMRNPYRFSFDRGTGQLYIADVGQGAWEEIDIGAPTNFGWRIFEGNHCTNNDPSLCGNTSGFTFPITEYGHTGGRCSVTGGYVYRGPFADVPTGAYIFGDYCTGEIFMLNPANAGGTQSVLLDTTLNISSFGEDEAGELYVVDLNGSVQRIISSPAPPCSFQLSAMSQTFTSSGGQASVQVAASSNTCAWNTTGVPSWVSINSGSSGTGYGSVTYTVASNGGSTRSGTMTIAGITFTIVQSGGSGIIGMGTASQLAKFISNSATIGDSTISEVGGDIGIGTTAPGGVFDLQRSSPADILQRFWNTGSGGAKLRYVAATGQTSQLQMTDAIEWLAAIAVDNSQGLQLRVRSQADPNTESGLAGAARLTIARNGNVGIGTTTPGSKLTVMGDVMITGNLSKGSGSFRIDHPLDPANKYLSHSFVESPDMMNIYNGIVTLDDTGEAVVELPVWFEALNRDFRYQLTAIGAPGPKLHIAGEMENNRFRVAGGSGGLKVSWQVSGIRQDPFANAHRIRVEEEKPAAERGTFLHPELYGQTISLKDDKPQSPDSIASVAGPINGMGTVNQVTKFTPDGATIGDSTISEVGGDIGIGTTSPGGVFDLQRSSPADILQRFWNTGSGGAKLRYVAATGQTSQLQMTDAIEWLAAIAVDNASGMQFRLRSNSDPNTEATLAASARLTIARNGNVGIGTTTPGSKLTVAGNMAIMGNLSKGSGSFRIDHPLDPANKYLSHSFVESPDMMNIYNGIVTLDASGEAVVGLPEYFEALNRDFRYQLTAIGASGPNLYIAEEIARNRFRIAGGSPGLEVSWQVSGIRRDPFANARRIQVEEEKSAAERGTFLFPEFYGQTAGSKEESSGSAALASTASGPITGAGSVNRIAKFTPNGTAIGDSIISEVNGNLGIGTTSPGGVFDLQRSSPADILQRFWNTGAGGAKLRYVAATGQTSQLQMTDAIEWLAAIAVNNSQGLQLRVRSSGDANSEAALAASTRLMIARDGNVGIGTTNPTAKLTVMGDVAITGNLSKGSGSFRIDHPLDPANKYLSHSFVESPDMMNIYNGIVTLDASGEAVVGLPEYFEALNRDFRYQLTAVGAAGSGLYIAEKVTDNRFRIAGGSPGLKVSWQVSGIRQDPFANAHRIRVEEEKPAAERGTFLFPEYYSVPRERIRPPGRFGK